MTLNATAAWLCNTECCARQSDEGIRGVFHGKNNCKNSQAPVVCLKFLLNVSVRATFDSECVSSPGRSFIHLFPALIAVHCTPFIVGFSDNCLFLPGYEPIALTETFK